jgi:phospholipase/carboxylesterase
VAYREEGRIVRAMPQSSRRDFLRSASLFLAAAACSRREQINAGLLDHNDALLSARPGPPSRQPTLGLEALGLSRGRDGFIYVPSTYLPSRPSPLLVMLHGAGQSSREFTEAPLGEIFDKDAIVVVIPDSRQPTWDMILGDYGPDVRFIDRALALAFSKCRIDPKKVAVGGFSDGATYALSLGITNANLFILPIDQTSREIVAALKEKNYPLKYEEFEGGHRMTKDEVRHAIDWLMER